MIGVQARRWRSVASFGVFTLAMVALFAGLGVWQLQRRVEKHALIAALTERLAGAPEALPSPAQWSALTSAHDEFRRVRFAATYQPLPDAMVYSSGSAVREDVSGPGTWAFMPAALPSGETVVINAGFVQNTMQDRGQQDRAVARLITHEPETRWRGRSAGAKAADRSRRSTSIWSSRCLQAASQHPVRSRSISRTITCSTPSLGSAWRARW